MSPRDLRSSPHERMLAYLREGDRLAGHQADDTGTNWEQLYGELTRAADAAAADTVPDGEEQEPAPSKSRRTGVAGFLRMKGAAEGRHKGGRAAGAAF